ncbi:GIY-YIG nuclease family protein [Halobacteriovorax sp. ZH2_bin.1]|uniref:GIY-YIG nuclease family protein n=1 Tax=unclassified Halobacteriovorax TaxID=2639665 RepID=UPI00371E16FA
MRSYVYLMLSNGLNLCKIGKSIDPEMRLREVNNTYSPIFDLRLVGVVAFNTEEESHLAEREFHKLFLKYHYNLEFFHYNEEIGRHFKEMSNLCHKRDRFVIDFLNETSNPRRTRSFTKSRTHRALIGNLEKIIQAIKSESLIQKRTDPILSTNLLRRKYKLNPNAFAECIRFAEENKIFTRDEVEFKGKVRSFSYTLY